MECRNDLWLERLEQDSGTSFYLLQDYYSLPCEMDEFLQNGWVITSEEEFLSGYSEVYYHMTRDDMTVGVLAQNRGGDEIAIRKAQIISVGIGYQNSDMDPNNFVIIKGINLKTPYWRIEELMANMQGVKYTPRSFFIKDVAVISDGIEVIRISPGTNWSGINLFKITAVK